MIYIQIKTNIYVMLIKLKTEINYIGKWGEIPW